MPVPDVWIERLATLAIDCRPTGAPRWDIPGTITALRRVQHLALPEVALAVINAATDRELKTPGAIGNPAAPCWRTRTGQPAAWTPDTVARHERCSTCSKIRGRCETERLADDNHEFIPDLRTPADTNAGRTVEALKAEVQPMRTPAPRRETTTKTRTSRPGLDNIRHQINPTEETA